MSEMKHTPGSGYCGTYGPHVFAAAPELLASLKALLAPYKGAFGGDQHLHGCDLETITQAFAAVAKAEGRQP